MGFHAAPRGTKAKNDEKHPLCLIFLQRLIESDEIGHRQSQTKRSWAGISVIFDRGPTEWQRFFPSSLRRASPSIRRTIAMSNGACTRPTKAFQDCPGPRSIRACLITTERRLRDRGHLKFVALPSLSYLRSTAVPGASFDLCAEAGLSLKASDEFTVPLCASAMMNCTEGVRTTWGTAKESPEPMAAELWKSGRR